MKRSWRYIHNVIELTQSSHMHQIADDNEQFADQYLWAALCSSQLQENQQFTAGGVVQSDEGVVVAAEIDYRKYTECKHRVDAAAAFEQAQIEIVRQSIEELSLSMDLVKTSFNGLSQADDHKFPAEHIDELVKALKAMQETNCELTKIAAARVNELSAALKIAIEKLMQREWMLKLATGRILEVEKEFAGIQEISNIDLHVIKQQMVVIMLQTQRLDIASQQVDQLHQTRLVAETQRDEARRRLEMVKENKRKQFLNEHRSDLEQLQMQKSQPGILPELIDKMLSEAGWCAPEWSGPVELMSLNGEWQWIIKRRDRPEGMVQWSDFLQRPRKGCFNVSAPVLIPPLLGGWKIQLRLVMSASHAEQELESYDVNLQALLSSTDAYNLDLLRVTGDDLNHLETVTVDFTVEWCPSDSSCAAGASNANQLTLTLGKIWSRYATIATAPLKKFDARLPPIIKITLTKL